MLPPKNRLKKKTDFKRIFKEGKGFKEDFLILKTKNNNLNYSRFGFIVGKNFSKKATLRNEIKRKLRELIRIRMPEIKKGMDTVLIVTPGLGNKDFWEIREILNKLLKKARLIPTKLIY